MGTNRALHRHVSCASKPNQPIRVPALTFPSSFPFCRRIRVGRSIGGPSSTCRPPQDSCSAVQVGLASFHTPGDLPRSATTEAALARHSAIDAANRYRICALLHESECPSAACCTLQPPPAQWFDTWQQRAYRLFLFVVTQAVQYRESDHRSDSKSLCRLVHDADHGHQSTL